MGGRMKTHWFVGAKSPEMKYPLRYPGWDHYPPRKSELSVYYRWVNEHVDEFMKSQYPVSVVEKLMLIENPLLSWLKDSDPYQMPAVFAATDLAGGGEE